MFPTKLEAKEVQATEVYSNYSSRFFWISHLDAIAALITFVVFTLIISMLSFAGWMDPQVSQQLTNFNPVGQAMVFGAIFTVLFQLGTIQVKINLLGEICLGGIQDQSELKVKLDKLEKELTSIKSKQYKESTEIKSRLRGIESVVVGMRIQSGL